MTTTTVTNIAQTLEFFSVDSDTLTTQEKKALDEQGFLLLKNVIDKAWLKELRDAFERLYTEDKSESFQNKTETGTRHVNSLAGKGEVFERVYTYPKLLASVYHILKRDFRLGDIHGRDPLPGFGQQALHADWIPLNPGDKFQVANSLWILDDFTAASGATRIIPGSHLQTGRLPKAFSDPAYNHPNQIQIVAPAGSVLIFNAHLWHSGMRNNSQKLRRVLQCSFVARENRIYNRPEIVEPEKLSPATRYLLNL